MVARLLCWSHVGSTQNVMQTSAIFSRQWGTLSFVLPIHSFIHSFIHSVKGLGIFSLANQIRKKCQDGWKPSSVISQNFLFSTSSRAHCWVSYEYLGSEIKIAAGDYSGIWGLGTNWSRDKFLAYPPFWQASVSRWISAFHLPPATMQ